jgi:phytanoyl-CoA hydroxylase
MTPSASPCLDRFTEQELQQFQQDGFAVVRGLVEPGAVQQMKALAERHLQYAVPPVEFEADTGYPGSPVSREVTGGSTVRRLLRAYTRDPLFAAWAASPALAGRLRQLLGPRVALSQAHHNCVMTKHPAFSSATGWHQDIRYWAFQRPELVSVWLALGPERRENGCLRLVPGSHTLDLPREHYDDALFFRPDIAANQAILERQVAAELDAGDVLFFHARVLHAAGRNDTELTKLAAVFTYHAADNHPIPGTRSASLPDVPLDEPSGSRQFIDSRE